MHHTVALAFAVRVLWAFGGGMFPTTYTGFTWRQLEQLVRVAVFFACCTAIGGRGTEEISEWLQGGFCIHDLHACMIEFRSDHACMIQNSETDWMHARGQPASARAWPAASGQLAGWRMTFGVPSPGMTWTQ